MEIGTRIKELRTRAGLTQKQLAGKIGVTPAAVGNYEQGVSFPKETVLKKLFGALDCSPNELFGEEYFSEEDFEHLRLYSRLDSNGKRAVDECTAREYSKTVGIQIAARGGSAEIALKKRTNKSILDASDYKR